MKTTQSDTTLTKVQRRIIAAVGVGAALIAGIGFVGSYAAVARLAQEKGFGKFAMIFPVGVDAGILVLLALDLVLTWLRIPLPMLRHTAWLLTTATIAFNGAAAWPDPLGVGMHAVIPVLFVVTVEAARHATGRIADITADKHMDGVRLARWFLAPWSTFRLWRRMKLWELRSYETVIQLERQRLVEKARLRGKYGRGWRRKAPVEAVMALRLTRYGREMTRVEGVLDIEHAVTRVPVLAQTQQPSGDGAGEPGRMLGSVPAQPALPPVSREPGDEPVSPGPVSREPVSPAHEPGPEPSGEPSFGEHATAAIEITLPTPTTTASAAPAGSSAQPAHGEPSPEPDREPASQADRTGSPAAGEKALATLRAFSDEAAEPVSPPADPRPQPAPIPAPAHTPALPAEQQAADAAWHALKIAAQRAALEPAHRPAPLAPREPQLPQPVSRPVSPEPHREPGREPVSPTPVSREPVSPAHEPAREPEPTREPGQADTDVIEQQITTLLDGLRNGDELTKRTAAQLLAVSEATAGRRLKVARTRFSNEGTGFYP